MTRTESLAAVFAVAFAIIYAPTMDFNWTLATYGQMALEASEAKDPAHIPLAIKQLSQECIQKVLGK